MRPRRRGRPLTRVALLVLAVAGLVVMHGFDAGAVAHGGVNASAATPEGQTPGSQPGHGAGADHGRPAQTPRSTLLPHAPDHVYEASTDLTSSGAANHLAAVCVVVLAVVAAGVLRRLDGRVRARGAPSVTPARPASARPCRVFRPPRLRLAELSVLTC
jgi:hypothetical protein